MERRTALLAFAGAVTTIAARGEESLRYGLIGKMTAATGQRDKLIAILLESTKGMPGCLSYVVAEDLNHPDDLWISEVWDSKVNHDASLKLPQVRAAITKARPLIASFADQTETRPVGGVGLP